MLSHGAWARYYGSDPQVIGRELRTSRAVYTIVGIAPQQFDGTVEDDIVEFFVALQHYEPTALKTDRMSRPAWAIARLGPGRSMAEAEAQVAAIGATLARERAEIYRRYTTRLEPMGESWRESLRRGGSLLFLASAALLVIAAINVGCLLLARVLDRRRELAIRSSLGAGSRQLMLQLFAEAALLVTIGGVAGAAAGPWLLNGFLALAPVALPHYVQLTPDVWTVAATIATLAVAGLVAGTVPALVGRHVQPGDVLRESGRGTIGRIRERRWTTILIAAETALTLVLLVAGSLLFRSFDRLDSVDLGFDRTRIARLAVTLNPVDVGGQRASAIGLRPAARGDCRASRRRTRRPRGHDAPAVGRRPRACSRARAPARSGVAGISTPACISPTKACCRCLARASSPAVTSRRRMKPARRRSPSSASRSRAEWAAPSARWAARCRCSRAIPATPCASSGSSAWPRISPTTACASRTIGATSATATTPTLARRATTSTFRSHRIR